MISKQAKVRALKALIALSALVAAPVTAAVITARPAPEGAVPVMSVAALTLFLSSTALQTEANMKSAGTPEVEHKALLVNALEGAIAGSGVTADDAIAALVDAEANMKAAGTLSPACDAAIAEILARIRAFRALDETPSSVGGDSGTPAFSSPPTTGDTGSGGSDYRPV